MGLITGPTMEGLLYVLVLVLSISCTVYSRPGLECGISPVPDNEIAGKVVGGREALPGQWPWQASLWYLYDGEPEYHFCGATIINDQWIMTAAHCLGFNPKHILIRLNEYNLTGYESDEIDKYAEKVFVHPDWSWSTGDNDIGLVKMNSSLNLKNEGNNLKSVCLPTKGMNFEKKNCMSVGWGLLEFQGDMPELLQEVEMPIVSEVLCQESYGHLRNVTRNMICAGHMEGSKGVCHGDSGGPLQCQDDNGRWYEVGITSWGLGCAWKNFPGVFARVDQYLNWIEKVTSTN